MQYEFGVDQSDANFDTASSFIVFSSSLFDTYGVKINTPSWPTTALPRIRFDENCVISIGFGQKSIGQKSKKLHD